MTEALLVWPVRVGFCLVAAFLLVFSATADAPPAGVSGEEWASIQNQIESERHAITKSDRPGATYRADNPTQRFTAHFGAEDVVISPSGRGEPAWELNLRLTAWGAAHDLKQIKFASVTSESNRIEYRRGALTEWYVNTTMGLEQGFTIEAPPDDDITELVLEMTIGGNLTAELAESGQAVTFRHGDSSTHLTYSGLKAWDAVDAPLEARMELVGGGTRLRLVVRVAGAAWPVVVDPFFVLVAKLLPTTSLDTTGARFGRSVATNGELMVIGASDRASGGDPGAAHVFQRDQGGANAWGHVATLTPPGDELNSSFALSVSISGDTVVVGAHEADENGEDSGSACIFQRDHGGPDAWGLVTTLFANDAAEDQHFGASVSISGDTVVAGAPVDDDNGIGSGAAYIYYRNEGGPDSWGQIAKINSAEASPYAIFGSAVAVDGDTVLIGAYRDWIAGISPGSAFVFQRDQSDPSGWIQVAKLTADDGAHEDYFGRSVAISGDTAFVGAPGHGYPFPGAAYVYRRNENEPGSWGMTDKITSSSPTPYESFGYSIAIDMDSVVIGAPEFDFPGAAYVFQREQGEPSSWNQVAKIRPADGTWDDRFGYSVAISGETAIIGAPYGNDDFWDSGLVYIHQHDAGGPGSWGQSLILHCPPIMHALWDKFGYSVGIDGDTIIVGAPDNYHDGPGVTSAYIFQRDGDRQNTWIRVAKLIPSDDSEKDAFGYSVALSGDTAVVGAFKDDDSGTNAGAAYIYQRDHGGFDAWGRITKITLPNGTVGDCLGTSVSVCGDTALVGSPGKGALGSASVFGRDHGGPDNWGQVAEITPASGRDQFGTSVSIDSETAVVGSPGDIGGGSAFVFYRDHGGPDAWGLVVEITPDAGTTYGEFGKSVSIDGEATVIGSPNDNGCGSASVFRRDQGGPDAWGLESEISCPDGTGYDKFGTSVSINGDTILVGAPFDSIDFYNGGAAFVYRRGQNGTGSWGQIARIAPLDGAARDEFGASVFLGLNTVIIGAPDNDNIWYEAGAAYVYNLTDAFFADGFELGDTSAWSVTVP